MAARLAEGGQAADNAVLEAVTSHWPEAAERPSAAEPVAPFVRPATPEVRTFTPETARQAIENDWMYQAGNKPDLTREIARTRALAARLGLAAEGLDGVAEWTIY